DFHVTGVQTCALPIFSSAAFSAIFRPAWLPNNPLGNSLLVKDGPEHAKLRALINRAFTPKNIARFEPRIGEIAAELADAMCGHEIGRAPCRERGHRAE